MKGLLVAVTVFALIGASEVTMAKSPNAAPMKMTITGEGRWSVRCTLEVGNGNIDREEFSGGKAGPVAFTRANLDHGSCDYKTAAGKPLSIAIEGWPCPLSAPDATKCEQAFAVGSAGSFRFAPRTKQ
jgi:hypothetical protein